MSSDLERTGFETFMASSVADMKNSISLMTRAIEQALARQDAAGDDMRAQLAHLLYEGRRINGNLVQLLSVYRIGNATFPVNIAGWDVGELLIELAAQSRALLLSKNLELTVDCAADGEWLFDRDLVSWAMGNALNNACCYARRHLRLSAGVDAGILHLRVEDDGQGYPESLCRRETFEEAPSAGSTGLGLQLAAEVARLHVRGDVRGSVRLENGGRYGGGCFALLLP